MEMHEVQVQEAAEAGQDVVIPATGERFEKSELEYFVIEDRNAGKAIGKLLASVFLISLVLMSVVCIWMLQTGSGGHDPQAGIGKNIESDDHH